MTNFVSDLNRLKKQKIPFFRPIDISELRISLFKSIIMPEFGKGVRFVKFIICFKFKNITDSLHLIQYQHIHFNKKIAFLLTLMQMDIHGFR